MNDFPLVSPLRRVPAVLSLLFGFGILGCASHPPQSSSPEPTVPVLRVGRALVPPAVQAEAKDPAWEGVEVLRLVAARNSPSLHNQTRVQLLWDETYLYVRFLSEVDSLFVPHRGQRDLLLHQGDVVEIFLDPVGDGRQWYEFQFSPFGDVHDLLIVLTADPVSDADGLLVPEIYPSQYWASSSWDVEDFRHATRLLPDAENPTLWITDVALPARPLLKRLRRNRWEPGEHRAHFVRYDRPEQRAPLEHHTWNPAVLQGNPHRSPTLMGILKLEE